MQHVRVSLRSQQHTKYFNVAFLCGEHESRATVLTRSDDDGIDGDIMVMTIMAILSAIAMARMMEMIIMMLAIATAFAHPTKLIEVRTNHQKPRFT